MHKLNDVYSEMKKGTINKPSYRVDAYVDDETNDRFRIPPIIHLATLPAESTVRESWLFQELQVSKSAVIRKAIELFDQYVVENEAEGGVVKDV